MSKDGNYNNDPTILEAVDNLSSMAELDIEELAEDRKEGEESLRLSGKWLDPKNSEKTFESVKGTFKVVHDYLKHIYQKENTQLKDKSMQKGVQSIMTLANEAAEKIDVYAKSVKGGKSVSLSREYQALLQFYQKKILKRFEESLESEDAWEEELQKEEDAADIQRRGLKDLETVTRDRDYELFFIRKENGTRFYNKNLARHIRLVADFDQIIGKVSGDDPLVRIRTYQDRATQVLAASIKEEVKEELDLWIKKAGKYREDTFVAAVYRAMMALMLASNSQNLLTQTSGKTSLGYFKDFQFYLRQVLYSVDYQRFMDDSVEDIGTFYELTMELVHKVCYLLFTSKCDLRDEYSYLSQILQKETIQKKTSSRSSLSLWNELLDDHELLVKELKHYPSGPLFKILDSLIDMNDESEFDPFLNLDRSASLYQIEGGPRPVNVLRTPCPTRQKHINKASILIEFHAALRHLSNQKKKFVIINMQDRTSWKEYARSHTLERFQREAEIRWTLDVITLPKYTDFFLQSNEYLKLSDAKDFKQLLFQQIEAEEECGYYFPRYFYRRDLHEFTKDAIEFIHKCFFGGKATLSRKNRLDFIAIFYHCLTYKIVLYSNADNLAYMGKDGVDLASISTASFYAFMKLVTGQQEWKIEEGEFLASMVFLPALFTRERAVDFTLLSRAVSMLSVVTAEMEVSADKVKKGFAKLFDMDPSKLQITH